MTYDDFIKEIKHRLVMADIVDNPHFSIDNEKGMYKCFVNGTLFTANSISRKITAIKNGRKFQFSPLWS